METQTTTQSKRDVYAIVTSKIIDHLEKGTVPWRKPWAEAGQPMNLISGKPYRGINILLLSSLDYSKNFFLSEKQLTELGGTPKPEEKPHVVVFWNWKEEVPEEGKEPKQHPILRYYKIYNVAQCEGIPSKKIPKVQKQDMLPIEACERIIQGMPQRPEIVHSYQRAFYDPIEDLINIPPKDHFKPTEAFYSTLYHEMVHSTGHRTRLNRKGVTESKGFGTVAYSMEEMVAEIGACFLNSRSGILPLVQDNSSAYIDSWIKVFKNDHRFIVFASSFAQKAVDYILNEQSVPTEHPQDDQQGNGQ